MKKTILLLLILSAVSCTTYRTFIPVQDYKNIPNGVSMLIIDTDIEYLKNIFTKNGILLKAMEGGFETETIYIDEGTRAMYRIYDIAEKKVRLTAFWGITQKVKSDLVVYAGSGAASAYDVEAWSRVMYDNNTRRPKRVFDYAIQIIIESGLKYNYQ